MHSPNIQIGIDFLGRYKILDFTSSFENLCLRTKIIYELSDEEMMNPQFSYTDEEGDEVNISNSFDLENAYLFAIGEELKVLYLQLENVSVFYNDFINETTESIKCYDEKDIMVKENDYKLNNFLLKEKNYNYERQKLINLFLKKIKNARRYFYKNILESARTFKENTKKTTIKSKSKEIESNQNKTIYNKKICERILMNSKDSKIKYFLNENELKDIVKKVIEEEIESMKSRIMEKSIHKAMEIIYDKKRINEGVRSLEEIHNNIECRGCKTKSIKGCRYKCTVCYIFDFCEECEFQFGKEHKHPFLKIRKSGINLESKMTEKIRNEIIKKTDNRSFDKIESNKINENLNNLRNIVSRIIKNGNANIKDTWNLFCSN